MRMMMGEDRRLGRIPEFDVRSRRFPVTAVAGDELRSRTWRITAGYVLDQGWEGSCVGFATTNVLLAAPLEKRFPSEGDAARFAREDIYWRAQQLDEWPGGAYPGAETFYEGTSVLAGIKAAREQGYLQTYRWSFGLLDFVRGLVHAGPALLGLYWYEGCYFPDEDGVIRPTGPVVGGHAVMARALRLRWKGARTGNFADLDLDASQVVLRNSWGPDWGPMWGDALVSLRDMGEWLAVGGEAAFFTKS